MGEDVSPSVLRHVLDRSCRELDERLRRGESVGAETYLARHPLLATDTEAAVELICQEYLTKEELGHQPATEEFLLRFAPWRDRLNRQLTLHAILSDHQAGNSGDREDSTGEHSSGFGLLTPRKGSYKILRVVARGNNVIYEATQSGTGRRVALKCIGEGDEATSEARGRLLAEARAASRLRHPNIVQVFDIGVQDDVPFLAMEFIDGPSLAQWLKDARPSPLYAAQIAESLARALQHAHAKGVIHRDLSPANIMLTPKGAPIITDFGLALYSGQAPRRRRLGGIVGTPGYMAPEQVGSASAVTAAADIHALGAILYEMLTGRPPFPTELSLDALERLIHEEAIPPRHLRREIPATLEAICLNCLKKAPTQRYQSAGALADDLAKFQRGEPIRPFSILQKLARLRVPEKAILLLGAAGVAGLLWQQHEVRVQLNQVQKGLADQTTADRLLDEAEARLQRADRQRQRLGYILDLRRAQRALDEQNRLLATDLLDRLRPHEGETDLRGFEWYALYRQLNTPVAILPDIHEVAVYTVACAPDGQEFVTGDIHGTLVIWNAQTLQPRRVIPGHESIVAQLRYTPDGRRFVSVCGDPRGRRQLKLWDAQSGRLLGEPVALQDDVQDLAITSDGLLLTLREHAPADRTRLWSITPGGLVALRTDLDARYLAISPEGKRLATVAHDGLLSVEPLDASSGAPPSWSLKPEGRIEAIAWRPDGRGLVVATDQPNLVGITPGEGVAWTTPRAASHRDIRQLRFDPSGASLIAVDARGLVVLDANGGAVQHDCVLPGDQPLLWSAISPEGTAALTVNASQQTLLWDLRAGKATPVAELQNTEIRNVVFSNDGRRVLFGAEDGRPRLWRLDLEPTPQPSTHQKEAWCVAFSPLGTRVASGGDDNVVRLWKPDGDQLHVLEGHGTTVSSLAFTPDGKHLVSGDLAGGLILWDLDRLQRLATLNPPRQGVQLRCLRIAPNGQTLATAWSDGTLRLWDLASQSVRTVLSNHRDKVQATAFSADGRLLASVGDDATVRLWDVRGVQPNQLWRQSLPSEGTAVTFSPDGATLAVGLRNGRIELRDPQSGDHRLSLQGHVDNVCALVYTSDGETLFSASLDGKVQTWDPQTGRERILLIRHPAGVHGLALSPGGTQLVSCDHDGTLRLTFAPRTPDATAQATAKPSEK